MSQNNTIKKSDKKFIRLEKARIRRQFLDVKKQQELIDNLYKRFLGTPQEQAAGQAPVKKIMPKKVAPKKAQKPKVVKVKAKS